MKVLVFSGFLGAGKTTFIKELIRRSGERPVVLENEYGDNDIDKRDISKTGDLEILEFMEGCVCCTKKDTFLNTVLSISAGLDPEYLVVEPTGVGKLGNILENIGAVTYDRIKLLPPVVILAPTAFDRNMTEFPDIYRNQIENAGKIVLSKTDVTDESVTDGVISKIKAINEDVEIIKDHYTTMPDEWFRGLLDAEKDAEVASVSEGAADLDEITIRGGEFSSPGQMMVFLEDLLRGAFGDVVRAKGVMTCGSEKVRFDVADGLYGMISAGDDKSLRQSVFIGRDIERDKLFERCKVAAPTDSVRSAFLNSGGKR